jgi:hypothetical protein
MFHIRKILPEQQLLCRIDLPTSRV